MLPVQLVFTRTKSRRNFYTQVERQSFHTGCLCGEFSAQRAREIGLVQEVVPAGQQISRAMDARNAPLDVQVTKSGALRRFRSSPCRPIASRGTAVAEIAVSADGRFVDASSRGHDSIGCLPSTRQPAGWRRPA